LGLRNPRNFPVVSVPGPPNYPTFYADAGKLLLDAGHEVRIDNQDQTDAHIENTSHFLIVNSTERLKPTEHGRNGPTAPHDSTPMPTGNIRARFSAKPPPVIWAIPCTTSFTR
jgi:hypothetical protein